MLSSAFTATCLVLHKRQLVIVSAHRTAVRQRDRLFLHWMLQTSSACRAAHAGGLVRIPRCGDAAHVAGGGAGDAAAHPAPAGARASGVVYSSAASSGMHGRAGRWTGHCLHASSPSCAPTTLSVNAWRVELASPADGRARSTLGRRDAQMMPHAAHKQSRTCRLLAGRQP